MAYEPPTRTARCGEGRAGHRWLLPETGDLIVGCAPAKGLPEDRRFLFDEGAISHPALFMAKRDSWRAARAARRVDP